MSSKESRVQTQTRPQRRKSSPQLQTRSQCPAPTRAPACLTTRTCRSSKNTSAASDSCSGLSSLTDAARSNQSASSSIASRQHRYRLPSPNKAPPNCEPIQTNLLWKRVHRMCSMSERQVPRYLRETESSKNKVARTPTSSSRTPSKTLTVSLTQPSRIQTGASKNKVPRVTDQNFREEVFPRYGITVGQYTDLRTPYEYFGTVDPEEHGYTGTIQQWYQKELGHQDCNTWLSMDEEDADKIAKQYVNMITIKVNEAKLSHRGKNYFFREDDIFGPQDKQRCSSTYFELEWAPNPDGQHLCCPPEVSDRGSSFPFTTNPDCTYWLTTRRMNIDYRNAIDGHTFVLPDKGAAAPYLTIEFKKDGQSFEAAENQIVVSGMLILYNRFRLRYDRLRATKQQQNLELADFDDIKHFGIAVNGSKPSLYVLSPCIEPDDSMAQDTAELKFKWIGCKVIKFKTFELRQPLDVLSFANWVNEFTNWGLGSYSRQFVIDIKGLLRQQPGGTRVSLSDEEKLILGID